jgi:hypothetical protein
MSERTRTTLGLVLLSLGTAIPFLIGAFSGKMPRPFLRTSAEPIVSTGNSVDRRTTTDNSGSSADSAVADGLIYRSGVPFLLDYGRSLERARVSRKPVLLFFTVVLNSEARAFEVNVLKSPEVVARLRKFECAAVVLDIVPHPDALEATRLCAQNQILREIFFEDQGYRWRPTIAVVSPGFDGTPESGARHLLAKAGPWELPNDPAAVIRFLDEALKKWPEAQE